MEWPFDTTWSEYVKELSFRQATRFQLLLCREGLLRSSQRSVGVTWKWKKRLFVLVDFSHENNNFNDSSSMNLPPMLLAYKKEESMHPSLAIRISNLQISSQEHSDEVSYLIDSVAGHPNQVNITFSASSLPLLNFFSVGSDLSKKIINDDNIKVRSWRLRFSVPDEAVLWKEAMIQLVDRAKSLETTQATAIEPVNTQNITHQIGRAHV